MTIAPLTGRQFDQLIEDGVDLGVYAVEMDDDFDVMAQMEADQAVLEQKRPGGVWNAADLTLQVLYDYCLESSKPNNDSLLGGLVGRHVQAREWLVQTTDLASMLLSLSEHSSMGVGSVFNKASLVFSNDSHKPKHNHPVMETATTRSRRNRSVFISPRHSK